MIAIKKWMVRRVAVDTITDERIVDAVISHQFDKARKAMDGNNSIELSGFGRFYFNRKKAKRKLARYEDFKEKLEKIIDSSGTADERRASKQFKLGKLIGDLKSLERKLENDEA